MLLALSDLICNHTENFVSTYLKEEKGLKLDFAFWLPIKVK